MDFPIYYSATSSSDSEEMPSEPGESSEETRDSEETCDSDLDGYCVEHLLIIGKCLESSAVCNRCCGQLIITMNPTEGIAIPLELKCKACSSSNLMAIPLASKSQEKELNLRSVSVAHFVGKNYAGLRRFFTILGLPVAVSKVSYYTYAYRLHDAIVEEARGSMQVASNCRPSNPATVPTLSEKTLLKKCVGGYTQNQKDARNNMI